MSLGNWEDKASDETEPEELPNFTYCNSYERWEGGFFADILELRSRSDAFSPWEKAFFNGGKG